MGWETDVVTNNYIDFHRLLTMSCCREVCSKTSGNIPYFLRVHFDPDDLIKLVRVELTCDALRQDIKQELEHVKNTYL